MRWHQHILCVWLVALCVFSLPAHAANMNVSEINDSGITAWMIEDNSLPLIAVTVTINHSGSAYDGDTPGLASLTAAMLTEGAGELDALAFQEALDYHAIRLSAAAGRDHTSITMQTLSEHADVAFRLLGSILTAPRFDAADVERIRTSHIAGLKRLMERPGYKLERAFSERVFAGHPYSVDTNGTPDSLAAITRQDLQRWINTHIAKNQLVISIAGDISITQATTLLNKHLGSVPMSVTPEPVADIALTEGGEAQHVTITSPQSQVSVALPGVARGDKDFYTFYVLNHILGGSGLSARLGEELRQERGLTYGVYSGLSILEHAHWLEINFSTQNARRDEAIDATRDVLATLAKGGVTQEERDAAISYLTGAFPLNIDSNQERAGYLNMMQREQLGKDYLNKRNDFITAVTQEALNKAAATYLSADNPVIISVGGTAP